MICFFIYIGNGCHLLEADIGECKRGTNAHSALDLQLSKKKIKKSRITLTEDPGNSEFYYI